MTVIDVMPDALIRVTAKQLDEFDRHYDGEMFAFHGGEEVATHRSADGRRYYLEIVGTDDAIEYVAELAGLDEFDLEEVRR